MMDELLSARPGTHSRGPSMDDSSNERGINFTMFLTMMSERLFEFETEAELLEAFGSFDENDSGAVKVEEMRKWLSEFGERMNDQEASCCACCVQGFLADNMIRLTDYSKGHSLIGKAALIIVNG